jgi:hypothetical protein
VNQLEDRLSALLHSSAPPTQPIAYEPVVRLARSVRRRRQGRLAAAALALIGLSVGLGFVFLGGGSDAGRQELTTRPTPAATPSGVASRDEVRQGGLTYAIPPGWKRQLTGFCGPQPNMTVAGAFTPVQRCPYVSAALSGTSVSLGPIWSEDSSGGWTGKPTNWQGQPAYLDTAVTGSPGEVVQVLAFPLLNARVTAVASDARAVRALLDRVTVHVSAVPIPQQAFSIRIVRTNPVRPQSPPVVITDPASVSRLLGDLRRSPKADAGACLSALSTSPTVITVHPSDGAAVSFLTSPDQCPVLTAGTGASISATPALVADVNRYVPADLNLPPDPSVTAPTCLTSQLTGSWGGSVSPQTQEHSAIVNLRNEGATCQVFGYPFVDVFDAAGQIAAITQNGGGYIQDAPSVTVLQPGQSVHLVLAASACGMTARTVTRVQVTLLGNLTPVVVTWPDRGTAGLQICPGYNGALVQIGPLVAGAEQGQ